MLENALDNDAFGLSVYPGNIERRINKTYKPNMVWYSVNKTLRKADRFPIHLKEECNAIWLRKFEWEDVISTLLDHYDVQYEVIGYAMFIEILGPKSSVIVFEAASAFDFIRRCQKTAHETPYQ